uniref:Uncharacterized protein n=1 Tax=Amphimedon queenslandica TaxID=400682 RepID=A0A1X7UCH3_AMPQE
MSTLVLGSFLRVTQKCNSCNKETQWDSQPFVRNIPEGNLLMSACILFTGCLPELSICMFQTMGCACISRSTFYYHQSHYLHPAIFHIWDIHQQSFFCQLSDDDHSGLILGGDGRSDSPGHSAKFGLYSLVELTHNVVIDIPLVQSHEVKNSNHMELEGLKRAVNKIQDFNITIDALVTDRHQQISIKKKVLALAKQEECEIIGVVKKYSQPFVLV